MRDTEAISGKQCFIVPAQTQQTRVQRLSPQNKGSHLMQAGYRSKKQGLIHVGLYLILLATLPWCYGTFPSLVLPDLPRVQISQVLSLLCRPYSLLLCQDSGLVCFLLILLPATMAGGMPQQEHIGKRRMSEDRSCQNTTGTLSVYPPLSRSLIQVPFLQDLAQSLENDTNPLTKVILHNLAKGSLRASVQGTCHIEAIVVSYS
jgi:hypothetical protein